jgi:hypothetical protein
LTQEDWQLYLKNLEDDERKLEACLGGVEISQASSKGVFDFNTEDIMRRYATFLQETRPPIMEEPFPNDEEVVISPKETRAADGTTGDPKADPKEKVPDTDENGQGLGRKANTLDQWLNQIITHPEATSLNDIPEGEDRSYNSANFWKEDKLPSRDIIDLILQEIESS